MEIILLVDGKLIVSPFDPISKLHIALIAKTKHWFLLPNLHTIDIIT